MRNPFNWKRRGSVVAAVLGGALLLAGCASTTNASAGPSAVVTFAEQPGAAPNFILPLQSGAFLNTNNLPQFSQLLYLPLYWFGSHGEPTLNEPLSLAYPPAFSSNNTVVTVNLKHWVWSDGTPVTARDVVFWMNLLSAVTDPSIPQIGTTSLPGPGWGASSPGAFPENVVSYSATGTYSLVFKLNASYNPTWFTYNELSQIYPMPTHAWDRLSLGGAVGTYDSSAEARSLAPASAGLPPNSYLPNDPGTATSGALGVAAFLNDQAENLSTYDTSPLWRVVDGPFRLAQFTTAGFVKMVPNREYSGTPKPAIAAFEELPFTSTTSELNALLAGQISIGYVPPEDAQQRTRLEQQKGYSFSPWYDFGIQFAQYNFTNPTVGPVLRQLYFRQALQSLVNQPLYIKQFMSGFGTTNNGPVPTYPPKNPDVSPLEAGGAVYPYDPAHAVELLRQNGWSVHPGGETTCVRPGSAAGECGSGISQGESISIEALYASGYPYLASSFQALQSTMAAQLGVQLSLKAEPASTVISTITAGCTFNTPCSTWGLADWATGYTYYPDYFPTGGTLFATGAAVNNGDYSDPTNNANIDATHTAPTNSAEKSALFKYEDYLARQLPVVWMPNSPYQLTLYKQTLKNVIPQGIYDELYPQAYRLG
jgi:peptide/nickel transport system substrate-binding protein